VTQEQTRCGYVALLGRPNVGKSSLLNRLIGQKISITAAKPQTTRHSIMGISTRDGAQILYIDTPGMHLQGRSALNRYLNRTAGGVLSYVDVIVLVVEALRWGAEDEDILRRLESAGKPMIVAVNKVDRLKDKRPLLPYLQQVSGKATFLDMIPVSARSGENLQPLEQTLASALPSAPFAYPDDQVTDVSVRFLAAELIREQLTRLLQDELPYSLTVDIEQFDDSGNVVRIGAIIWVERTGQKGIVIGQKGRMLKQVGMQAREAIERMLDRPVHLETWVKVRSGWSDDERALQSLGYRTPD
jgi:GTP-binding protein Era